MVGAMAILAAGRVGIFSGDELAVFAALVLLALVFVALGAIHRVSDGFAGTDARDIHLGVALAAGNGHGLGARVRVPRTGDLGC